MPSFSVSLPCLPAPPFFASTLVLLFPPPCSSSELHCTFYLGRSLLDVAFWLSDLCRSHIYNHHLCPTCLIAFCWCGALSFLYVLSLFIVPPLPPPLKHHKAKDTICLTHIKYCLVPSKYFLTNDAFPVLCPGPGMEGTDTCFYVA